MERIKKSNINYKKPIGTYAELMQSNDITAEMQDEYAKLFEIAANSDDNGKYDSLTKAWEKIIPAEILKTI